MSGGEGEGGCGNRCGKKEGERNGKCATRWERVIRKFVER